MSSTKPTTTDGSPAGAGRWEWLPPWARPLERERRGLGSLRLAESTILILIAVFLAIATIDDVVQQTHVNHRLSADLLTWRTATGHHYINLSVEQDIKTYSTRDTVCGNVSPGAPGERTQICLTIAGPIVKGARGVTGGYYLPPYHPDEPSNRYACFGLPEREELCAGTVPHGAPPHPPLAVGRP